MTARPFVSVIVPVYKVEKFIRRTVNSLLEQEYGSFELIFVDDGSPDRCPEILDDYASSNSRLKVIHQENSGVSEARNAGIRAAKGDYLMFVDGDDWVERNYISYFVNMVERTGCEVGMDTSTFGRRIDRRELGIHVATSEDVTEMIYLEQIYVAVWNKIYSSELVKRANLMFEPEIWFGEGMLFNIEALQFVDRVAIGDMAVYHQVANSDSATRSFDLDSMLCGIRSLDRQKAAMGEVTERIGRAWRYHRHNYNRYIIQGLRSSEIADEQFGLYKRCVREIRSHPLIPMSVPIGFRSKAIWVAWMISPTVVAALIPELKRVLRKRRIR